ncbi:uncharacterized protein (DUF4415 family) [Rhizobium sp. PP-CC-2G-626]|nr:uncharacterized protein (DUF4415 family) [Rhizobium sp. PP-CC-2G-626]
MTKTWPSFVTKDLGENDDAEMLRRWQVYNDQMQAIIRAGGVHQDADGWWIDDATGELIGPDPDIERPLQPDEGKTAKPFREVFPDLAASIDGEKAKRGRPAVEKPKQQISIRLSPEVIDAFKATGKGWQSRIDDVLRKAAGL